MNSKKNKMNKPDSLLNHNDSMQAVYVRTCDTLYQKK